MDTDSFEAHQVLVAEWKLYSYYKKFLFPVCVHVLIVNFKFKLGLEVPIRDLVYPLSSCLDLFPYDTSHFVTLKRWEMTCDLILCVKQLFFHLFGYFAVCISPIVYCKSIPLLLLDVAMIRNTREPWKLIMKEGGWYGGAKAKQKI